MRVTHIAATFVTLVTTAISAAAQSSKTVGIPAFQTPAQSTSQPMNLDGKEPRKRTIAIEADVIAYGLPGYSGIVSLSLANGFQVALGTGRYDVPGLLLKGDANYVAVHWKATSTSVQVLRATYRLNGPMKSGLAIGGVVLNQNWRLRAERLSGETKFRPISAGITAGYYIHVSKHLYVYPTTAFTYNTVNSGSTTLQGTSYKVARFAPNGSLHMGWEW